ncbi:OmpA family protein [Taibaiella koreensis]|uniref:OmpA family protein n=1 Tax=Taibaiella koreensis TaxID=1268548 RepID=UPI000E59D537|nr:OmpA family protein [Taibaiella koreensis]
MAVNFIELARSLFSPDLISRTAVLLGESEAGVTKAADALVPTILAALFAKGQEARGAGLSDLLHEADNLSARRGILALLEQATGTGGDTWRYQSSVLLHRLFDGKTHEAAQLIADYSGLKGVSAESLLGASAPPILSLAADQARAEGKSGDHGFWAYLIGLKEQIWRHFPAGFSIAGLRGATEPGSGWVSNNYTGSDRKKGGGGWLWILLLAVAGLGLWYLLGQKGCRKTDNAPLTTDTIATASRAVTTESITTTKREPVKVQLPDGTGLDAYKGGIEDQLVTFLQSDYKSLGADSLKKIWFDFDNLNFETGSATITPGSQVQINNLAAILKAFPQAKLKIGGYTDKTGNEQVNVKLSGERAAAVKKALEAAGVGGQIDGAEGYGSQFARFPAEAPEEDRIQDRHVSVSVRG